MIFFHTLLCTFSCHVEDGSGKSVYVPFPLLMELSVNQFGLPLSKHGEAEVFLKLGVELSGL